MGFLDRLFGKKTTTDVKFQKVKYTGTMVLENNYVGGIESPKWENVAAYLDMLFKDNDEFVTLTLAQAVDGIRFMQACWTDKGYSVQLGIEEGDNTVLVEKLFDQKATVKLFKEFFTYGTVYGREDFKPMEFKLQ